ncbi:MAG: hypothetical protein JOZ46_10915 [Candidatus Dormibacteraeota bacterium]|nr:hypothetical protein [Candidatus Dormibacteraeota bacterium]MBV9526311.1 hypothetical protein [Candidatus Dormibacteraeota bacterium]
MSRPLSAAELRLVSLVAARRFAGTQPDDSGLAGVPEAAADAAPFARAAAVAAAVLRPGASAAVRPAALLAVCAQLGLDGFELLAPQGATAGMVAGLAAGTVSTAAFSRWLEDRAVAIGALP